jgi:5'(3')-deoxyribonucleotidase
MKTVFLDMDGVLVDFVGGLHRALGLYYNQELYPYKAGCYDMFPAAVAASRGRHTMDSLHRACYSAPFWARMKWDRRGREILGICEACSTDVYLASYPMDHPEAWAGKLWWINENMPAYKTRVMLMTVHKQILARPNTILIDDRDDNVDKFIAAGGEAYLIPQPWNSKYEIFDSETDWMPDFDLWMKTACKTTLS